MSRSKSLALDGCSSIGTECAVCVQHGIGVPSPFGGKKVPKEKVPADKHCRNNQAEADDKEMVCRHTGMMVFWNLVQVFSCTIFDAVVEGGTLAVFFKVTFSFHFHLAAPGG